MSKSVKSFGTDGIENGFVTIFISAHGEDVRHERTPDELVGKIHKFTTAGVTGNLMWGSREVHALLFNYGRIFAHNRDMHHIDKLHELRNEVLRYADIDAEIENLQRYQSNWVTTERASGKIEVTADKSGWLSEPSPVRYNRNYSFTANPWGVNQYRNIHGRHKHTMEANRFGIWLVDASIPIANRLKFQPGIHRNAVSMMAPLGILPTTLRRTPSHETGHSDTTATRTTLFDIVRTVQTLYGLGTYVNIIDVSCRFNQWDRNIFEVSKIVKPLIGEGLRHASAKISPWSERLGKAMTKFAVYIDGRLSPRAVPCARNEITDYLGDSKITYWETNGAMKVVDDARPGLMVRRCIGKCESDIEYEVFGITYKVNELITFSNGTRFRIFYILSGTSGTPTWFFVHTMSDDIPPEEKTTLYITPNVVTGVFDFIDNPVMPLSLLQPNSHIHNVTSFRPQHTPAVVPAFVRNFLPPYEYAPTGLHYGGGATSLKRKRVRSHKRTHTRKRRQYRHRSKSTSSKSRI
jgi:hypothetical protein